MGGKIMKNYPETIGNQKVFLDFDGENTFYENSDLDLNFAVTVKDSGISEERQQNILALLNEKYRDLNITFTNEKPLDTEFYSTVFVGKTDDFADYGSFAGMAETIDKGNEIKNDDAFVMLDDSAADSEIIQVIDHELGHIIMGEEHENTTGEMADYAATYWGNGNVTTLGTVSDTNNTFIASAYDWMSREFVFTAGRSGYVDISISGTSGQGGLYDSSGNLLASFGGSCYLAAGNTYSIYFKKYRENDTFTRYTVTMNYSGSTVTPSPSPSPSPSYSSYDLVPYHPSGWSAPIVLSTVEDTHTDSAVLSADKNIYADFALTNNSSYDINSSFTSTVYLDGFFERELNNTSLESGHYSYWADRNLGKLSPGWHTIMLTVNSDGDLSETNGSNNSYTKKFYVSASDLRITNMSVDKTKITGKQTSVFTFTVNNQGKVASQASELYVYRNGYKIDSIKVSSISAGGSRNYTYRLKGSELYYKDNTIKFEVDGGGALNESNESNNTVSKNIRLLEYDLAVTSVTVDKNTFTTRDKVKITVTVTNYSNVAVGDSKLYFYDRKAAKIGGVNVTSISSGGSKKYTYTVSGSKFAAGNNKIIVKADATSKFQEINEKNNRVEYAVTVKKAIADLAVTSVTMDKSTFTTKDKVKVTIKVTNKGTIAAAASKLYLYNRKGTKIGGLNVSSISAGGTKTYTYTVSGSKFAVGSNKIIVKADATNLITESNSGNNRVEKAVTVKKPIADLAVTSVTLDKSTFTTKDKVKVTVKITNKGTITAAASKLYFYDRKAAKIGGVNVSSLAAGASKTYTYTVSGSKFAVGSNKIIVKADATNLITESNSGNNRVEKAVTVKKAIADLAVTSVTLDKSTFSTKDNVKITVKITNKGTITAAASKLYFYDRKAAKIGGVNVSSLAAGASKTYTYTVSGSKFAVGSNKIIVKADATNLITESNSSNNRVEKAVTVTKPNSGKPSAAINLTAWDVRGYEDVNKDGFADLLLGNESDLSSWEDAGEAKITALCRELPGNGWEFAGVADFNGDGSKEILLYGGNETFKPESDEKGKIFMPIA